MDKEAIGQGTVFDYVFMDCKLQCSFTHGSFTYPSWLWVELSCKIDHNRYMTQGETPLITLLHYALMKINRDFFFFSKRVINKHAFKGILLRRLNRFLQEGSTPFAMAVYGHVHDTPGERKKGRRHHKTIIQASID